MSESVDFDKFQIDAINHHRHSSNSSLSDIDDLPDGNNPPSMDEYEAASKIQALARGGLERQKLKDKRLWDVWQTLDQKEESELMESHQHYEQLKNTLKPKLDAIATNNNHNDEQLHNNKKSPTPTNSSTPSSGNSSPSSKTFTIKTKSDSDTRPKAKVPVADDGLILTDPIHLDFVTAMMDHFKFNKLLDIENVVEILRRVKAVLEPLPNVIEVDVKTRLTVVGDLHGQLDGNSCKYCYMLVYSIAISCVYLT